MNLDRNFKRVEESKFLRDLIPVQPISIERKALLISQFEDINKALLQKDLTFLAKVKKFLDITLFEF